MTAPVPTSPAPDHGELEGLGELRAKAEAATTGEWHESDRWVFVPPADEHWALVNVLTEHAADLPSGTPQANAAYIAAANPAVVLGLLDEIDRLRAPADHGELVERLRGAMERHHGGRGPGPVETYALWNDSLRALAGGGGHGPQPDEGRVAVPKAEWDALVAEIEAARPLLAFLQWAGK